MAKKNKTRNKKQGSASFVYNSICCKQLARKPAVIRSEEDKKERKYSECGLGHWRCSQCGKPCKVTVSKPEKESNGGTTDTAGTEGA